MQPTPELPSSERDLSMAATPAPISKSGAAWFDSFQARNRATLLKVLLGLVVLALAWWGVQELTKHRTIPAGKAAAWSTQLDLARQVADQKEKGSQLFDMSAKHAAGSAETYTGTLLMDFSFVAPSGRIIEVEEEDTQPAYAYPAPDSGDHKLGGSDPGMVGAMRAAVALVKISPREALEATLPQLKSGNSGASTRLTDFEIRLRIRGGISDQGFVWPTDGPVVWTVIYLDSPEGIVLFSVDATTGQVLEKRPFLPDGLTPTVAVPSPTTTP